jgi:hypothetical protein
MVITIKRNKSEPVNAPKIKMYTRVYEGVVETKEGHEVYELIPMEAIKTPKGSAPEAIRHNDDEEEEY